MTYTIKIHEQVTKEDLKNLTQQIKKTLITAMKKRIAVRPYDFKPLKGKCYRNTWRLRVGDYRIVYKIEEDTNTVYILCIEVRGNIYDKLQNRVNYKERD